MKNFVRQFSLWRHYRITTASLVIVLFMISIYRLAETKVLMRTYGMVKDVNLIHIRQHKAIDNDNFAVKGLNITANLTRTSEMPQHHRTKVASEMKTDGIKGNMTKGDIRQRAASVVQNFPGNQIYVKASLARKTKLPPLNPYWSKILHFVPEENSQNCLNLFTTESSRSTAVTPQWEKIRSAAHMPEYRGNFAPQHVKLALTYQELARLKFVHTVCEIGFNVGQSAITWLTAKSDLKLYSFDIGGHLPEKMGGALKKLFPDRFELTIGDSTKTVPLWREKGVKCDIVSIDGGHSYPVARADILNMRKAAAKQHIIVLDDIYFPGVNKAWKEMVKNQFVNHLFDCFIKGQDLDFALGNYKNIK